MAVLALAATAAACAGVGPLNKDIAVPEPVASTVRFHKEYVLAPEDQLEVVVRGVPEASRVVIVRPDGFITLPLIEDVRAAGLTSRQLDVKVTELLSARLRDPEVTVITMKVRQPVVYVTGEVNNPVVVPLRDAPSAAQALAYAGGFRRTAATGSVAILRLGADGRLLAMPASSRHGGQTGRFLAMRLVPLEADDVVFVPESGRSQFARVLDDFVNRPLGGFNSVFMGYVNFRFLEEVTKD